MIFAINGNPPGFDEESYHLHALYCHMQESWHIKLGSSGFSTLFTMAFCL